MVSAPTELYLVAVYVDETRVGGVYFNATVDEACVEALGIVTAQGGDYGDIYQHTGADRLAYFDTVTVQR